MKSDKPYVELHLAKIMDEVLQETGLDARSQADLLREMGCDMAQGFCFSEPTPTE